MSDPIACRTGWLLPVLLALTTSAAAAFAFLYFKRPGSGELGSIRVSMTDDNGKGGSTIHVVVAEAPFEQRDTVAPGSDFGGIVHYPTPYLSKPNLKLTSAKRQYQIVEETPFGFTWAARPLPEDFRDDAKSDDNVFQKLLTDSLAKVALGNLKSGLVLEDFTWQASGLRAGPADLPPQTFEQKGLFKQTPGQQGPVNFPIPYRQAPNVKLNAGDFTKTVITEVTPTGFKWKNTGGDDVWNNGQIEWTAVGVR
jgi:hypothetical protein